MLLRLTFLSLLLLVDGIRQKLPDFIIPCVDDPNLEKCPAQLLERIRHRLVKGISELQLPPIDPLYLPPVTMDRLGSSITDFTTTITNMMWTGAGSFKILETFADIEALVFRLRLKFPYLYVRNDATAEGTVLGFEVRGAGNFSINTTNAVFEIVLNGERYEHEGRKFITWTKEDVGVDYSNSKFVQLHGFLKDPSLVHVFKTALNKGSRLIARPLKRFIVDAFGNFIIEAINRVHSLYSIDVLYPRTVYV